MAHALIFHNLIADTRCYGGAMNQDWNHPQRCHEPIGTGSHWNPSELVNFEKIKFLPLARFPNLALIRWFCTTETVFVECVCR